MPSRVLIFIIFIFGELRWFSEHRIKLYLFSEVLHKGIFLILLKDCLEIFLLILGGLLMTKMIHQQRLRYGRIHRVIKLEYDIALRVIPAMGDFDRHLIHLHNSKTI